MPSPSAKFHLRHDAEEDRLLILIDAAAEQHYAMALTRRLAKLLLAALADTEARRRAAAAAPDPARRDAGRSFEHEHAVAQALSSGETRRNEPARPLVAPPRLVREIKLTPKPDGGVVLALDDRDKTMTIDLDAQRLHSFMAAVLEVATNAGWDLPRIATWLERARTDPVAAAPKLVH